MFAICRIEKLKTEGNIGGLNSHLTRTMEVPNCDKELSHLNHRAVGSEDLNLDVRKRLEAAKITPRKNAVLAVEHLLTASPEFFNLKKGDGANNKKTLKGDAESNKRLVQFKSNAIEWLNERYGKENVVNITVHLDETTPHIHAIVVPIDKKGKLNARDYFGGRDKMRLMQDSYAKKMEPLGLTRGVEGSKARHTTIKEFYGTLDADKTHLSAIKSILDNRESKRQSKLDYELREAQKRVSNAMKQVNELKLALAFAKNQNSNGLKR